MKNNTITGLMPIALGMLMLVATSCDENNQPGKTGRLTAHAWKVISYQVDGEEAIDEYFQACHLDDAMVFTSNGSFVQEPGSILCDVENKYSTGTWKFKANETIISLRRDGEDAEDWKIKALTAASFKFARFSEKIGSDEVVTLAPR
jgi:hypothetical protein